MGDQEVKQTDLWPKEVLAQTEVPPKGLRKTSRTRRKRKGSGDTQQKKQSASIQRPLPALTEDS